MKRILIAALMLVMSASLNAQRVGEQIRSMAGNTSGQTIINLGNAVNTAGNLTRATYRVYLFSQPCTDAVFIKFFRPSSGGRLSSELTFLTERGPFTPTTGLNTVVLDPPVAVLPGDMIGYYSSKTCGRTVHGIPRTGQSGPAIRFVGRNVTGNVTISSADFSDALVPGVYATAFDGAIRQDVLLTVASTAGSGGSFFRTQVTVDGVSGPTKGRLVYNAEGASGSATNPSIPFALLENQSLVIPDFLGALGLTGKGSVDIYTDLGFLPPNVSARIYESAAGGTKGFTLESMAVDSLIGGTLTTRLNVPEIGPFRMNVGVRTLTTPATITFRLVSSTGVTKGSRAIEYPAEYYEQVSLTNLLPGVTPVAGDTLIANTTARAWIYGSTIDNTSQDPSVQIGSWVYLYELID